MRKTPRMSGELRITSKRVRTVPPTPLSLRLGGFRIAVSAPQSYVDLRHCLHTFVYYRRAGLLPEAKRILRETYAHLLGRSPRRRDEAGFPLLMANLLRQTLIAHARAQNPSTISIAGGRTATIMDVDAMLTLLERRDAHTARIIELYYFAGLQPIDIGAVLLLEPESIKRTLRVARAWLIAQLAEKAPSN